MIFEFIDFVSNNPAFRAGLFFVLGACLGSFFSALHYRIPRKLNWATDRSRCTSCGHVLGVADLVPVLSWVFSGGKCRHCDTPVSVRYPVFEVTAGLVLMALSLLV